jgi:integrase
LPFSAPRTNTLEPASKMAEDPLIVILVANPVAAVRTKGGSLEGAKVDGRKRIALTPAQVVKFLQSPAPPLVEKMRVVCSVTFGGMRTAELNRWRWDHIARDFAEVMIVPAKAKRGHGWPTTWTPRSTWGTASTRERSSRSRRPWCPRSSKQGHPGHPGCPIRFT